MLQKSVFIVLASLVIGTATNAQASPVCSTLEDCLQLRDQVTLRIAELQQLGSNCHYFSSGYYTEVYDIQLNLTNLEKSILNYSVASSQGQAQSIGRYTYFGKDYLRYQVPYPNADAMEVLVPVEVKKGEKAKMGTCNHDSLRGPCGSSGHNFNFSLSTGRCE